MYARKGAETEGIGKVKVAIPGWLNKQRASRARVQPEAECMKL